MDLQTLWFILIAVLFTGFLFLEGFDYGVGILLPFVGKDDQERRMVINSIGPVWDGNEVWLLTAGGAIFAAFPNWYATLFSGFYLALFLILLALIVRGVAFEFRSKDVSPRWRSLWDACIFIGSFLPALLWGVAFGNILRGVAIDASMTYVGSFFDLLNPVRAARRVGHADAVHPARRAVLGTEDRWRRSASAQSESTRRFWLPVTILAVLFVVYAAIDTDILQNINPANVLGLVAAVGGLLFTGYSIFQARFGRAFFGTGLTIVGVVALIFGTLFPRVMPSSLDPAFDLTIYNASSSAYTLQVMTCDRPDDGADCAGVYGMGVLGFPQAPDERNQARILTTA